LITPLTPVASAPPIVLTFHGLKLKDLIVQDPDKSRRFKPKLSAGREEEAGEQLSSPLNGTQGSHGLERV